MFQLFESIDQENALFFLEAFEIYFDSKQNIEKKKIMIKVPSQSKFHA